MQKSFEELDEKYSDLDDESGGRQRRARRRAERGRKRRNWPRPRLAPVLCLMERKQARWRWCLMSILGLFVLVFTCSASGVCSNGSTSLCVLPYILALFLGRSSRNCKRICHGICKRCYTFALYPGPLILNWIASNFAHVASPGFCARIKYYEIRLLIEQRVELHQRKEDRTASVSSLCLCQTNGQSSAEDR